MPVGEKVFQPLAFDDQLTALAYNQMLAFEQREIFGHPRPGGAHQFGQVLVPRRHGQPHALPIGNAEVLAQLQQNQSSCCSDAQRAASQFSCREVSQNRFSSSAIFGFLIIVYCA